VVANLQSQLALREFGPLAQIMQQLAEACKLVRREKVNFWHKKIVQLKQ
jgi:hypothetical protein